MRRSGLVYAMSWTCVVLMLSTLTHEICLAANQPPTPGQTATDDADNRERVLFAQPDDPQVTPDSTWNDWAPADTIDTFLLFDASDDSLSQGLPGEDVPVYRKWWFWAASIATLILIAVLASGDEEKGREDLPDFPDPPER
jgi:hypothetical protein